MLPLSTIPQEIVEKYNLLDIVDDGWVYMKIVKGMYKLPQADNIPNDLLIKRIRKVEYHLCQQMPQ